MIDTSKQFLVKSFSGELEIVGNGVAPVTGHSPLKLQVADLEIELHFEVDPKEKESSYNMEIDGKKLVLTSKNFDNALGTGVIKPIAIGHLQKRKLYLSYWVWTPSSGEGNRIINWTILLGGEQIGD